MVPRIRLLALMTTGFLAAGLPGGAAEPVTHRYEAEVPATLDLAERARLAINALTSSVDPADHYNMYFLVRYTAEPPYMLHMDIGDFICCNPKWAEALPMLRLMSGSNQNLETERKFMAGMVDLLDPEDGLFYLPPENLARKPWYKRGTYAIAREPITSPFGDARLLLAMAAWYQRDHNPRWLERMRKLARGLAKVARFRDDYAYYPEGKVGMEFSYLRKSGYNYTEEARSEHEGAEGSVVVYQGNQIRALCRWCALSGDREALELAGKLARYVTKPKFWGAGADSKWISGPEHAHFDGHHHGRCTALRGLLEYAQAANSPRLKEFVRDGYEYARSRGIARLGCFGDGTWKAETESCSVADMVALAIRLSDYGAGDYWDDVDQYVRNRLAELQLLRRDLLEKVAQAAVNDPGACKRFCSPAMPILPWGPENWDALLRRTQPQQPMTDHVLERSLGQFAAFGLPTTLPYPVSCGCCTGNCTEALYYAWESIVRCKKGEAQVNLLLNRASPWLDVDSYLPYEGKVVIRNKAAKRLAVRIPRWVDQGAVKVRVNERETAGHWLGHYLTLDRLADRDVVTITFPMVEETARYTMPFDKQYTCTFKGNTLVDISPRDTNPTGYPIYQRAPYKQNTAPMRKLTRYVSGGVIDW